MSVGEKHPADPVFAIPGSVIRKIRELCERSSGAAGSGPQSSTLETRVDEEILEALDRLAPLPAPVAPGPFPDRLGSEPGDPGHPAWRRAWDAGYRATVLLNGEDAGPNVTIADPRLGLVRRGQLNEAGNLYARGDMIAQEDLYGRVEITLVPRDGTETS